MAVTSQAIRWSPPEPWGELQPEDERDWQMYWLGDHHGVERTLADRASVWGVLLLVAISVIVGGAVVELLHVVR